MTQHTKFIYLFIYLFIFNSCDFKNKSNNLKSLPIEKKKLGEWSLLKSEKIGEWKKGVDYLYTQKQLESNFKDVSIEFTKEYIIISELTCSGTNQLVAETLDFNINGTNEDRKKVKTFLSKVFGLSEKEFKGIYNLDCEHPFNKIFDFGDKILVRESGVFYYLFVKQEERTIKKVAEGYNCEEIKIQNIYEEPLYKICKCNLDFSNCYSFFYQNLDDYYKEIVLKELPQKDTIAYFGKNFPFTEYNIYKNDSIKIMIHEEGGENEYVFKSHENKTRIEFYTYPL